MKAFTTCRFYLAVTLLLFTSCFSPLSVSAPNSITPTLVINDFLLANRSVPVISNPSNYQSNGNQPQPFTLKKPIAQTEHLTLQHTDNIFGFEFSTPKTQKIEQTTIEAIQFAYRLKGFNDSWIYTDINNRRATFTNIAAGDYQFEVKVRIAIGPWSNTKQLSITVLAPWWRTNIVYLLYVLLIGASIYALVRWRTATILTSNQKLTQQIEQRTKTISELMAQKSRMFVNVTNEFRTPLTLVPDPAAQLTLSDDRSSTNDSNNKQHSAAPKILNITKRLTAAKSTNKKSIKAPIQLQHYSLKHTLDYLMACFDGLFNSHQLTVRINRFDDVTLSLKPDSLEIILTNLISNAIKYTPNSGSININIEPQANQISITISDNGSGIDPKHQAHIFDHFDLDKQQSHTPAGTGIGLALTNELVTANQGQIELTSALNQGSSFIVTLPISKHNFDAEEPSNTAKQLIALEISNLTNNQNIEQVFGSHAQLSDDHKPLVLVIDDNQDLLQMIEEILSPHFDCQLAPNGEQGLQMAQEHLPDLVLSDIMMPGISGFEVLSELKSSPLTAHIPVILLTAKGDAESRIEGWKNRADEYLSKPFHNQELIARINNILAIRRMISNRYQQQFSQTQNTAVNQTDTANNQQTDELDMVAQHFSEQLEQVLEHHYQDEHLTVATIANELALSQRQLIRKTKNILDMTPNETLRAYRLKQAAKFLRQGQTPSTITFNVGFSSHSYFGLCFKAQFGCTPTEYRKQHLTKSAKGTVE